ncbi:unnamed protein product [Miscanthus lutarioriparius]|uniref:Uncharacterized protein n=1 Tax=Miscanthus lutarioriparius TaxID=422564 RepID=A0A811MRF6_9POAL|nr:unnamed protein product [Miscanthus lutarioriparius]
MDDGACLLGGGKPASAGGGAALDGRGSGVVAVRRAAAWGGEGQRREDSSSASNPIAAGFTAAATLSGRRGALPPRGPGGLEGLDLNCLPPDLDYGTAFGQLLRSSSVGAVGDAEAALVPGGVRGSWLRGDPHQVARRSCWHGGKAVPRSSACRSVYQKGYHSSR